MILGFKKDATAPTIDNQDFDKNECSNSQPSGSVEDEDKKAKVTTGGTEAQHHLDEESDRMLKDAKKQVKQMMEEAVTKKFIHEGSSSIISLCVAIDACLSHKLKRRTLGLFKTNSSTALVQKIAKNCSSAQEVLQLVEEEEKRQYEEELQRKQSLAKQRQDESEQTQAAITANFHNKLNSNSLSVNSLSRQAQKSASSANANRASSARVKKQQDAILSSSKNLHKRHMWLKCALIEKKLVDIVEYLASNAEKYYESDALMANCLSAQLLCSLLVGPSALEFSRSKTNDYYQFDEPSAEELLNRHKLSNPIACLCSHINASNPLAPTVATNSSSSPNQTRRRSSSMAQRQQLKQNSQPQQTIGRSLSAAQTNGRAASPTDPSLQTQRQTTTLDAVRERRAGGSDSSDLLASRDNNSPLKNNAVPVGSGDQSDSIADGENSSGVFEQHRQQHQLVRKESQRRRPLALKTNVTTSSLVTDCHHCSCKEIIEHQQTRGYSFKCKTSNSIGLKPSNGNSSFNGQISPIPNEMSTNATISQQTQPHKQQQQQQQQQDCYSLWSPRMLHETLHQNSKSSLLYAKNNVLLETQAHGPMAGYLSLHQTRTDLIIKWIPNQLINGGHQVPCVSTADQCDLHARVSIDAEDDNDGLLHDVPNRERRSKSFGGNEETDINSNVAANSIQHQQQAVGSSYLDLVVSLSVSRIVLIHCHFLAHSMSGKIPPDIKSQLFSDPSIRDSNGNETPISFTPPKERDAADNEIDLKQQTTCNTVETLILVEADGVQRAPFKFPKGGLRWFLSCLENGLHPNRYLELAIKPEGWTDWPWAEDEALDSALENSRNNKAKVTSIQHQSNSAPDSATNSEPISRLDLLLKRLPSLKRSRRSSEDPSVEKINNGPSELPCSSIVNCNTTLESPPPGQATIIVNMDAHGQASKKQTSGKSLQQKTINYVYRIVSTQQYDWPLSTPPLSAFSITSSSSSSFSAVGFPNGTGRWSRLLPNNANGNNFGGEQHIKHRQSSESSNNERQRFRWSLSRLTRFPSRYSGGSSSSSIGANSIVSQAPNSAGVLQTELIEDKKSTPNQSSDTRCSNNDTSTNDRDVASNGSITSLEIGGNSVTTNSTLSHSKRDSSSELIRIEAKLDSLKKSLSSEELLELRDQSVQTLCESMRKQILARAFYGWLAYCRRTNIIRTHLMKLIKPIDESILIDLNENTEYHEEAKMGLTESKWDEYMSLVDAKKIKEEELSKLVNQHVYYGGVKNNLLRIRVWPYLLGHFNYCDSAEIKKLKDSNLEESYKQNASDWTKIEKVIKQRDNEILAANMARVERRKRQQQNANHMATRRISETASTPTTSGDESASRLFRSLQHRRRSSIGDWQEEDDPEKDQRTGDCGEDGNSSKEKSYNQKGATESDNENKESKDKRQSKNQLFNRRRRRRPRLESTGSVGSDASITDQFGNNIHRIDKDVQRCDRQYWYFQDASNLTKLRNIMCSYVWQHLDVGYVQGMCDLAAPFLVIFDDELRAFCCFNQSMKRMIANFPHGNAMDRHFESLKYLMQVLDPKLFEVMQKNGDYSHFYFCYRWLLLDFKRELAYEDVFRVWETIWSAQHVISDHFVVFLALAMVRFYRDIIIENNMDFTDTIKFFNEMAERHDVKKIIELAQNCILELESLIKSQ